MFMPKVDCREHDSMIQLATKKGYISQQLEVGDYESEKNIEGLVVRVERKSDDFLQSVFTGNLLIQLKHMTNDKKTYRGYLIVDRTLSEVIRDGMARAEPVPPTAIFGVISSLTMRGFPPIFCDNQYNAMEVIDFIFKKHIDGKDRNVYEKTVIGGDNLLTFPGVDTEISKRLLTHFGSFKNIANATKDQLLEVRGIGPVLSERIWGLCNKEYGSDA